MIPSATRPRPRTSVRNSDWHMIPDCIVQLALAPEERALVLPVGIGKRPCAHGLPKHTKNEVGVPALCPHLAPGDESKEIPPALFNLLSTPYGRSGYDCPFVYVSQAISTAASPALLLQFQQVLVGLVEICQGPITCPYSGSERGRRGHRNANASAGRTQPVGLSLPHAGCIENIAKFRQ